MLGLLIGGLSSGFVLAIFMANAGGAWDNAVSLCEREIKEEEVLSAASIREADSASTSSRKAGAKVRTFKYIFQIFPEVFFFFLLERFILG